MSIYRIARSYLAPDLKITIWIIVRLSSNLVSPDKNIDMTGLKHTKSPSRNIQTAKK